LGQKQTSIRLLHMSAFLPKADIDWYTSDVRFGPKADIGVVSSLNEKPRRHAGVSYLRG
jgi:hypothetical protein